MEQPEGASPRRSVEVSIQVDTSGIVNAARKFQAALLFDWHPDLELLDDELDVLYRGQM